MSELGKPASVKRIRLRKHISLLPKAIIACHKTVSQAKVNFIFAELPNESAPNHRTNPRRITENRCGLMAAML